MDNRLYVLVSPDITSIGLQAAQAGHVIAQWIYDNPNDSWQNEYLILLQADSHLDNWKFKLRRKGIRFSEFKEPDQNYTTTALAVYKNSHLFKKLKLIGS